MAFALEAGNIRIREVWSANLEQEFALIREIVEHFNYIAIDAKTLGIVHRPLGPFDNLIDYNYNTLKRNVDALNLIQLGLTIFDENGNLPTCGTDNFCVWQFNFREFNVNDHNSERDTIEALRRSGIDFKRNNEEGVDAARFGELLMSSGIVLNDDASWVTFDGRYDFGYLLKSLTIPALPEKLSSFFDLMNLYFPVLYDIKHLAKFCNGFRGRLDELAELLGVERIGVGGQAGWDSLFIACNFTKLRDIFFNGSVERYKCVLFGLGGTNN